MKHRFFIHFSTDLIIGLILIAAIHTPQEKHTKKPENTGKTITQKPLKYVTDTVYVSEETNLAKTATGTFIPATKQYVNTTKKGIYLHGIKKAYFSKQKK